MDGITGVGLAMFIGEWHAQICKPLGVVPTDDVFIDALAILLSSSFRLREIDPVDYFTNHPELREKNPPELQEIVRLSIAGLERERAKIRGENA